MIYAKKKNIYIYNFSIILVFIICSLFSN